jgi:hypothetical protein
MRNHRYFTSEDKRTSPWNWAHMTLQHEEDVL